MLGVPDDGTGNCGIDDSRDVVSEDDGELDSLVEVSGSVGTTAAEDGAAVSGANRVSPPVDDCGNVLPARSAASAANHVAVYAVADTPAAVELLLV